MTQTVKQDLRTVASDIAYALDQHDWGLIQEVADYLDEYAESIPPYLVMISSDEYEHFTKWKKEKSNISSKR